MNAVVRAGESLPVPATETASLLEVISRAAIDPAVDVEKMERLLLMQERIAARGAKAAYADALARLQPKLPILAERGTIKNRDGATQSRYALWEDIVGTITPLLAGEGFSLSFRTASTDKSVTVTGVLLHRAGHSEETSLLLPMDTSGSKNNVQGVGSSTSYGKRYTASALLNLRTGEADDDGKAGGRKDAVSDEQAANIEALLTEVGGDKKRFLAYLKVESIADIPAANYTAVIREIEAKRRQQ
jgi:hypothetical protein